jgi:hypothetical protein
MRKCESRIQLTNTMYFVDGNGVIFSVFGRKDFETRQKFFAGETPVEYNTNYHNDLDIVLSPSGILQARELGKDCQVVHEFCLWHSLLALASTIEDCKRKAEGKFLIALGTTMIQGFKANDIYSGIARFGKGHGTYDILLGVLMSYGVDQADAEQMIADRV